MKILLFTLLAFLFNQLEACVIEFPEKIAVITRIDTGIIINSNCDKETNQKVINNLHALQGVVPSGVIKKSSSNIKEIKPSQIEIVKLEDRIKNFISSQDYLLKEVYSSHSSIGLKKATYLKLNKNNLSPGVNLISFSSQDKDISFQAKLLKKYQVLSLNKDFKAWGKGTSLQESDIVESTFYSESFIDPFLDRRNITKYQLVKNKKRGDFLSNNDLRAMKLVKRNSLVNVIIFKNNMELKTKAKAMRDGHWGETIELKNLKSQKRYQATVTDNNEVQLKL